MSRARDMRDIAFIVNEGMSTGERKVVASLGRAARLWKRAEKRGATTVKERRAIGAALRRAGMSAKNVRLSLENLPPTERAHRSGRRRR